MIISNKPLDAITETDLLELVSNSSPELKVLEFKQTLPGRSDGEKKEFLYDVASFANASGGDLIYGIGEEKGQAQELIGLQLEDADAEKLRLESQILNGIEPRIPGLHVHNIPLSDSRYAVIIRVPRSWVGPHWVKFGGSFKFHSRTSAGKYLLDYGELRGLFALSETRVERLRQFRTERLGRIIAGDTTVPLKETPKVILHVLPWAAFDPGNSIRFAGLDDPDRLLRPLAGSGSGIKYNFDGVYTHTHLNNEGRSEGYLQLFRNGCFETVSADITFIRDQQGCIPSLDFEQEIIASVTRIKALQKQLGIEPPLLLMLSLLGIKGYVLGVSSRYRNWQPMQIDRNDLIVPEVFVDNTDFDPTQVLRPAFDSVWNAAGFAHSMDYDVQGNWKPQQQ